MSPYRYSREHGRVVNTDELAEEQPEPAIGAREQPQEEGCPAPHDDTHATCPKHTDERYIHMGNSAEWCKEKDALERRLKQSPDNSAYNTLLRAHKYLTEQRAQMHGAHEDFALLSGIIKSIDNAITAMETP